MIVKDKGERGTFKRWGREKSGAKGKGTWGHSGKAGRFWGGGEEVKRGKGVESPLCGSAGQMTGRGVNLVQNRK